MAEATEIKQLAGVIIRDQDGGILLLHRRTPERTQWEVPGGKLEAGEEAVEAAIREIREELGVAVTITDKIGTESFVENGIRFRYTWFSGMLVEDAKPQVREPEVHDEYRYWSIRELRATHEPLSASTTKLLNVVN